MALDITATPTAGVAEVVRALHLERGRETSEGAVAYNRILRHLPAQVRNVATAITSAVSAGYVQADGSGGYTLTASGKTYAAQHRPRGGRITVS